MQKEHKYNMGYLFAISIASALGGLLFGYDLLVISGAKMFYELQFNIADDPVMVGWAVSSCIVGCIVGAMFVGKPSEIWGRAKMLSFSGLLFLISAIGSGYAPTFTQFVLYRLLGGIGMGMASTLSPMYIAEAAPAPLRGRFVSINQLTIVLGILAAQFVNYMILQSHPLSGEVMATRPIVSALDNQYHACLGKNADAKTRVGVGDLLTDKQRGDAKKAIAEKRFMVDLPEEMRPAGTVVENVLLGNKPPKSSDADKAGAVFLASSFENNDMGAAFKSLRALYDKRVLESWNGQRGWRWMFAAEGIPAFIFMVCMLLVPASPRWLVKKGRDEKAKEVLERIGGAEYASEALLHIEETLSSERRNVGIGELFKPKMLAILALGVGIAVYQQWCGNANCTGRRL